VRPSERRAQRRLEHRGQCLPSLFGRRFDWKWRPECSGLHFFCMPRTRTDSQNLPLQNCLKSAPLGRTDPDRLLRENRLCRADDVEVHSLSRDKAKVSHIAGTLERRSL
jgi:hypothetical protein